jgi:hypothetical protein
MTLARRSIRRRPGRAVAVALYLNAALLAGILLTMLSKDGYGSLSLVQTARAAEPAMGGGGNLYLIPGQFSERTYGCYLMDTDAQTVCVYRFDGAGTKMKLVAARNFRHDRRLGHLNTEPDPKQVEIMVETERAGGRLPDETDTTGTGGTGAGAGTGPAGAPKSRGTQN